MAKRTFDEFDEYAENYREIHNQNIAASGADSLYFAEHKVLQLCKQEPDVNRVLLDVGCGDGATELFLSENFPSWTLYGVDVSGHSITAAINRHIPHAAFQHYDGNTLPYEDETIDIVFVAAVLHHVDFSLHKKFMQEIYRVMKRGGRLYLFEHNPWNPVTRYFVNTCTFDKDAKLLYPHYTNKLLRSFSFGAISKKFILFFPRKGIFSKLIGTEKYLSWLPLGGQYYFRAVK